jgi:tRNA threonylcarbamoyladenosine biosynthesis protein TsaB
MALLLAIDTSARTAGVALLDGELVLAEHTWQATGNHTTHLLPAVRELLQASGKRPTDLSAVATAIGPGAFTGLRVGIATAKTLAWSLGLPCLAVGSLDALAATVSWAPRVLAVLDAGRGEWYWASYAQERGARRRLEPPQIGRPEEVLAALRRSTFLVGDCAPAVRQLIAERYERLVTLADPRLPAVRPAALGLLAQGRLAAGECDEPATLQPVYLRRPAAEERKGAAG